MPAGDTVTRLTTFFLLISKLMQKPSWTPLWKQIIFNHSETGASWWAFCQQFVIGDLGAPLLPLLE